jgi:hypothetical protein
MNNFMIYTDHLSLLDVSSEIEEDKMSRIYCADWGDKKSYRILVRKPFVKLCFRPRRRYEDNIKMNVREIGCEGGR